MKKFIFAIVVTILGVMLFESCQKTYKDHAYLVNVEGSSIKINKDFFTGYVSTDFEPGKVKVSDLGIIENESYINELITNKQNEIKNNIENFKKMDFGDISNNYNVNLDRYINLMKYGYDPDSICLSAQLEGFMNAYESIVGQTTTLFIVSDSIVELKGMSPDAIYEEVMNNPLLIKRADNIYDGTQEHTELYMNKHMKLSGF